MTGRGRDTRGNLRGLRAVHSAHDEAQDVNEDAAEGNGAENRHDTGMRPD